MGNEPVGQSPTNLAEFDEQHHAIFPSGRDFFSWLGVSWVGAILLYLALTAAQLFSTSINAGDVAERDLKAPFDATIVDPVATTDAVKSARERVIPVFRVDRSADKQTLDTINASLSRVKELQAIGVVPIRFDGALNPNDQSYLLTCPQAVFDQIVSAPAGETSGLRETEQILKQRFWTGPQAQAPIVKKPVAKAKAKPSNIPPDHHKEEVVQLRSQRDALSKWSAESKVGDKNLIALAVHISPAEFSQYQSTIVQTSERLLRRFNRFPVTNKQIWEETAIEFVPDNWPLSLRENVASILARALEPNLVIDPSATKHQVDYVVNAVKPVTREVKQGQVLVKRGQTISEAQAELLQNLGITNLTSTPVLVGLALSLVTALVCAGLFLFTYEPKHFFSTTSVALMYTLAIITCATASLFGQVSPQFVPIPGAALILTIFFHRRTAIALILPLIILIGVDRIINPSHLIALTIAAFAAIFTYSKRRGSLMATGCVIAIAQALGYLIACAPRHLIPFLSNFGADPKVITYLHASFPSVPDVESVVLHFAGGLIASAMVAIGSLPFLENIFGVITPHGLAELAEADQPLLRQLEEKAPGTYQHSLAVANLAEAGAKAVSADVVLVRAGALYHDIGKMVRPKFFIENQLGAKNPHDSMTPEESRDRVLAHVTDGMELARKYSLPQVVADFIPMHQGTTLMAYFYHKACQRDGIANVDQMFYRYPGPKPNNKETAIVMLADVGEAVTHSMKDPTEDEVDEALGRVFQNRWEDGQFTDANFSYDELQRVKLAFVRVWRTLHHERLKYPSTTTGRMPVAPEQERAQERKGEADGTNSGVSTEPDTSPKQELEVREEVSTLGEQQSDCCG